LAAAAAFLRSAGFFFQLAEEFLEVLPGAEIAALAGHDDDLDLVVDFEPRERVIHLVVQRRRHGVALFRPVERRPGDAVAHSDFHEIAFVVGHRRSSSAWSRSRRGRRLWKYPRAGWCS